MLGKYSSGIFEGFGAKEEMFPYICIRKVCCAYLFVDTVYVVPNIL